MRDPSSRSSALFNLLVLATIATIAVAIYTIFVVAPVEAQMGIVQKIFYFHVPSAYAMYIGFGVSAFASTWYLLKRTPRADAIAVAGAEVGMLFCIIVLISGPMWARKAWGVWWTWDPRLTTTLLAGMIFAAYLALRSLGDAGEVEKKFASGLALVGLFNLPLIHYSVQRWRGVHPTVITKKGGGLQSDMATALGLGFLAFTFLVVTLIILRTRIERQRQSIDQLRIERARVQRA